MKTFLASLGLAVLLPLVSSAAGPPPVLRNDFTTNANGAGYSSISTHLTNPVFQGTITGNGSGLTNILTNKLSSVGDILYRGTNDLVRLPIPTNTAYGASLHADPLLGRVFWQDESTHLFIDDNFAVGASTYGGNVSSSVNVWYTNSTGTIQPTTDPNFSGFVRMCDSTTNAALTCYYRYAPNLWTTNVILGTNTYFGATLFAEETDVIGTNSPSGPLQIWTNCIAVIGLSSPVGVTFGSCNSAVAWFFRGTVTTNFCYGQRAAGSQTTNCANFNPGTNAMFRVSCIVNTNTGCVWYTNGVQCAVTDTSNLPIGAPMQLAISFGHLGANSSFTNHFGYYIKNVVFSQ